MWWNQLSMIVYVSSCLHATRAKKNMVMLCICVPVKESVDVNSTHVSILNISEQYTLLFEVNERKSQRLSEITNTLPSSDSEICDTSNWTNREEPGDKIKDEENDGVSFLLKALGATRAEGTERGNVFIWRLTSYWFGAGVEEELSAAGLPLIASRWRIPFLCGIFMEEPWCIQLFWTVYCFCP